MKKRMTYAGVKTVKKWIQENTFTLYEYAEYPQAHVYSLLSSSLSSVLKGKRNTIKIEQQTKLKTHIRIHYTPNFNGGLFTLFINKYEKHKT